MTTDHGEESELLAVRELTVGFPTRHGIAIAANKIDLQLNRGTTLGLVGESGCGKSVTIRSIIGMVPAPGEIFAGEVSWRGRDLLKCRTRDLRKIRGREIAMIFQDPAASLNPVYSVGSQLSEVYRVKMGLDRADARKRAVALLGDMGIATPERRARDYAHQLSGGMRQRVMIAMAVAFSPILLLADEPTTGLDVTIQDQILVLLSDLQSRSGMAMIMVSHDLGVIARMCDTVAVMYAGYVVECGSRDEVFKSPRHPYTRALLAAELVFEPAAGRERLEAIGGQPPNLAALPSGCPFAPRCGHSRPACAEVDMRLDKSSADHRSACPFEGQE